MISKLVTFLTKNKKNVNTINATKYIKTKMPLEKCHMHKKYGKNMFLIISGPRTNIFPPYIASPA